jgi:hypothetical protein
VRTRRLVAGVLMAGAAAGPAVLAVPAVLVRPAAAGADTPSAAGLYQQAIASTRSWSVHYASSSTQSDVNLLVSGDAGPASGSQSVLMGKGTISILVIGGLTYLKGNAGGLENLAGLSAVQATESAGQWIEFETNNAAFAPVVAGVRSHDVAQELALKGPFSLGRARTVDHTEVDAIQGTQTIGKKSVRVVLFVRAHGTHVPVEEDSLNAKGQLTGTEHVVYSRWGEPVRPVAPQATISIGPITAV